MRVYMVSPIDKVQLFELADPRQYEILHRLGNGRHFDEKWTPVNLERLVRPGRRKEWPLCDIANIASDASAPVLSAKAKSMIESRMTRGVRVATYIVRGG